MTIKVSLRYFSISPKKVQPILGLVRDQSTKNARAILSHLQRKIGLPLLKLLESAVTIAKESALDEEDLYIKEIFVNKATVLKRRRIKSRGRAAQIQKRKSHITLVLGQRKVTEKSIPKDNIKELNPKSKIPNSKQKIRSQKPENKKVMSKKEKDGTES